MLPIYDKFFATPETIQHKTTFGHIKACNDRFELNCDFTETPTNPCSVFFYAGNRIDEYVSDELFIQVLDVIAGHKDSILYLDTIIEDFIHPPFIQVIDKFFEAGVKPENIKVITSYNPARAFRTRFFNERFLVTCDMVLDQKKFRKIGQTPALLNKFKNVDIISYNGFSTSYLIHKGEGLNHHHEELRATDESLVGPRQFKKHFSLLQKNSRYLRKIFHAYFITKGYDKLSHYSWHNIGVDSDWGEKEAKACRMFNIPFDTEQLSKPVWFDDVEGIHGFAPDEWSVPDNVENDTAVPIVVETCNTRDEGDSLFNEAFHHKEHYFLSEKTYKNFYYGLPFIHLGMPFIDEHLKNMGYFTFRHHFDAKRVPVIKNTDALINDFALIDLIASMSLDELSAILNAPARILEYKHNKKMLRRLLPLKNLINELDKY